MGEHTKKAIDALQAKYKLLGSWAAVALTIGLEEADRAAVQKAAQGSIVKKVYKALGVPHYLAAREAARQRARLAKINGRLPLAGQLHYTDKNGRPAAADLSERAKRLGVTAADISAARLYLLIVDRAVPQLKRRIKDG